MFVGKTPKAWTGLISRRTEDSFLFNSTILGVMYANQETTQPIDIRVDDVYVDTTRARVELGNAVTFDSCTRREIQPCTAWASGAITINLNTCGMSGTNYLYVVTHDNVRIGPIAIEV
jgi:hypothetical protein